ncbi:SRPBCC family protein [Massilia brevitalea]|uniref:SRPBCC family protein n=1 Tax=Massilia brevitalea TaxID=442526 RepID=UPI0027396808|nr:SRPBCC family protein [Massilia brevitalea]
MAGTTDTQRDGKARQGGSRTAAAAGPMQHLGWVPVALGAAAIVAGLGGRRKGATALALGAVAGAGALDAVRSMQAAREGPAGEPEVERSITIGKGADELRTSWLDPRTLPQIMGGFATVRGTGGGRMHWKVDGPLGHAHEWETETVEQPGGGAGWRSMPGAAIRNEGQIRFQPAPAGRGTVATLRVRFEPPAGALGAGLLQLFGATPLKVLAEGVLRRFKNLVETGEIPTTARQPAARADTH